jgi:hypothetical protein
MTTTYKMKTPVRLPDVATLAAMVRTIGVNAVARKTGAWTDSIRAALKRGGYDSKGQPMEVVR